MKQLARNVEIHDLLATGKPFAPRYNKLPEQKNTALLGRKQIKIGYSDSGSEQTGGVDLGGNSFIKGRINLKLGSFLLLVACVVSIK